MQNIRNLNVIKNAINCYYLLKFRDYLRLTALCKINQTNMHQILYNESS